MPVEDDHLWYDRAEAPEPHGPILRLGFGAILALMDLAAFLKAKARMLRAGVAAAFRDA